jgi:hypothetical protein
MFYNIKNQQRRALNRINAGEKKQQNSQKLHKICLAINNLQSVMKRDRQCKKRLQ